MNRFDSLRHGARLGINSADGDDLLPFGSYERDLALSDSTSPGDMRLAPLAATWSMGGGFDNDASTSHTPSPLPSEARSAAPLHVNSASLHVNSASLHVNDTSDHIVNATESEDVGFIVSGLGTGASGTVTFSDAANHHVVVDVAANGSYVADLSSLTDGTITSALSTNQGASAAGNSLQLDTDKDLTPSVSVNGSDPSHVTFEITGLEGDEAGTITFTDVNGKQVVLDVKSNGNYSGDLSSLASGDITYLVNVTDPAGNITSFDPVVTLGDGSVNAPAGSPQLPHLLDGYATRPSWMVAGVDYAVGVPAGKVLTDWQSLSGPGISISGNMVRIDGQAGVHLDGIDFSLHGGAFLYLTNSPNCVVTNCKFQSDTPTSLIDAGPGSSNLTVEYCTLIGGTSGSSLIGADGNVTIEYNWMKDYPQHAVEIGGNTNLTYKYNLLENGGTVAGSHLNYLQLSAGGTDILDVEYNTTYETPSPASGEGFQFYNNDLTNPGSVTPTLAYNTMIATGNTAMSYMVHGSSQYASSNPAVTPIVGTASVHDNYFNTSGSYGAFYPGSMNGWAFSNNVDMVTGKIINADNSETAGSSTPPATTPAAPTIASFSNDSGVVGDHITNDNTLTLTGTAAANSTVKVFDGSTQVGTATANSSGAWSVTTTTLAGGSHALTATATNSGGTSSASAPLSVTIDTVAPSAPTIVASTAAATLASTHIEVLTGTAEANSTVAVFDGATKLGTATAAANGAWSYTTSALSTGSHSFTATATDAAGNTGAASSAATVTIATAPAAPTIASFSNDSGVVGDHITNDNTLTLTGTAAASSTVKVFDGSTQVGTATADASGAWSLTTTTLAGGSHALTATATNSGGTSSASAPLSVTIDTVAPSAPTIMASTAAATLTNTHVEVLTGTAEASSTVAVFDGTTKLGTATADATGAWSYTTSALSTGIHSFTATATDAAGNTGAASSAVAVTITTVPAAPVITSFSPDTGVAGDSITDANTVDLKGTAAANSTIKVYDGSTQIGTTTADSTGSWDYITSILTDAKHILTATATDAAGQTSAGSAALNVTVDTVAPTTPVLASESVVNTNHVLVSGTAEANSVVTVYDGTTVVGTGTTGSTGTWSVTTTALLTGTHVLTATATDVAGNVSAVSQGLNAAIAPPPPPTTIESAGSTSLVQVGNNYFLNPVAGGTGPEVMLNGSPLVADQFPGWSPVGTEKLSSGYELAMKSSAGDFSIWMLDNNGSYVTNTAVMAGTSTTLENYETNFKQDLNGDGVIGIPTSGATTGATTTVIEPSGSTSLVQVGNNYFLNPVSGGTGPEVTLNGSPLVAGQFPGWSPVGAEKLPGGYELAMKSSAGEFSIWTLDNHGSYVTNTAVMSGTSTTLENYETSFKQDLNGDGVIGIPSGPSGSTSTTIDAFGVTSLVQVGNNYFLNPVAGGTGPEVMLNGSPLVAGQFPGWSPVGTEKLPGGYELAMKSSAGEFSIWTLDNHGSYVTNTAVMAGTSATLENYETSFHQDLNGDGLIGVPVVAAPAPASTSASAPAVGFTNLFESSSNIVTIKGTADASSQIKVYDGTTALGTVNSAADGTWSFKTSSAVSDTVHTYTAQELDSTGQVLATSSGTAILGSTGSNTLTSSAGDDVMLGKGQADTFVFAANFGNDVIKDFVAAGPAHDTIQFSKTVFDTFASVLSHASQVGQDIVISTGQDTLTLKNTKLGALDSHDFHFA